MPLCTARTSAGCRGRDRDPADVVGLRGAKRHSHVVSGLAALFHIAQNVPDIAYDSVPKLVLSVSTVFDGAAVREIDGLPRSRARHTAISVRG